MEFFLLDFKGDIGGGPDSCGLVSINFIFGILTSQGLVDRSKDLGDVLCEYGSFNGKRRNLGYSRDGLDLVFYQGRNLLGCFGFGRGP